MRKRLGKGTRGLVVALALLLLSVGLVFALTEVLKEVPGSVTIVRADVLSPASLGVYKDVGLTLPLDTANFPNQPAFSFNISLNKVPWSTIPVWVKNLSPQTLVVDAQGGPAGSGFGVWLAPVGMKSCRDLLCTLAPGAVLAGVLGVGWDRDKTPSPPGGLYNWTIHFIGQTPVP